MSLTSTANAPQPRLLLPGLVAGAVLVFAILQYITWTQWRAQHVWGDAVFFNMMLSSLWRGDFFIVGRTGNFFYSTHVMLWMLPAGLLYGLFDSIHTYLVLLNAGLAASIVPLGLLAWDACRRPVVVALLVVLWIVNPFTASLHLSLHPESLIPFGWFLVFLAVSRSHWRLLMAGVACLLASKEDQALWLCCYAGWLLAFRRAPRPIALRLLGVALAAGVAFSLVQRLLPMADPGAENSTFWLRERFGSFGNTDREILAALASRPWVILLRIFRPVWIPLLLSAALLPLLAWRELLLAVPIAAFFFTADAEIFNELLYYYSYMIIIVLFWAACSGLAVLGRRKWHPGVCVALLALAITWSLVTVVRDQQGAPRLIARPTRCDGIPHLPFPVTDRNRTALEFVRSQVPPDRKDLRIVAHYALAAFVPSGRQLRFVQPKWLEQADAVAWDTRSPSYDVSVEKLPAIREVTERRFRPAEQLDGFLYLVPREVAP